MTFDELITDLKADITAVKEYSAERLAWLQKEAEMYCHYISQHVGYYSPSDFAYECQVSDTVGAILLDDGIDLVCEKINSYDLMEAEEVVIHDYLKQLYKHLKNFTATYTKKEAI